MYTNQYTKKSKLTREKRMINWLILFCSNYQAPLDRKDYLKVRNFILAWISTTVVMWFYVAFSYMVFDFPTVGNLGLIYTIIHTLTPILYRKTSSLIYAGLNISLSALCFQVTFCVFNGGIDSPSAIWFTAHPVIMSFFGSKKLILFSIVTNITVVLTLTFMGEAGYFSINYLDEWLTRVMRISSLILLDIIIASYTIAFIHTSEQNAKELKERNYLIESLIRIISHDVNNSLAVSNLTTALLQKKLKKITTEDQDIITAISNGLEKINRSNKQIEEISKSILEWMKINDQKTIKEVEPFFLSEIYNFLNENYQDHLEQKSINLKITNSIKTDTKVKCNGAALRNQILNNLMTNAIKFSPIGGTISVNMFKKENYLNIEITDQGKGIPESILQNIFDPTKSTSRVGTGGEKGTGFGMPIVKLILEKENSFIDIISYTDDTTQNSKTGTTMKIQVPLA